MNLITITTLFCFSSVAFTDGTPQRRELLIRVPKIPAPKVPDVNIPPPGDINIPPPEDIVYIPPPETIIASVPTPVIPPPTDLVPASVGDFVEGAAGTTVDFVESSANEVSDWTEGTANNVADWTVDTANTIADVTVTAVEETGDWIEDVAEDIEEWVEDAIDCVVSIFEAVTDACALQAMQRATDSCFLGNGPCRLEIKEANGQKCIGISHEFSLEESHTFLDEAAEGDYLAAEGSLEFTALARAEATTYVEASLTISNKPEVEVKFFPPKLQLEAEVSFNIAAGFSAEVSKRIELAEKRKVFRKIFMLGSIPVLVEGFAQPVAIGIIEGSVSVEGSITYRINGWIDLGEPIELKLRLDNGRVSVSDWAPTFVPSFDDSWEYDISGAAELTASAKVGIELTVMVDKLVEAMAFPNVVGSIGIAAEIGSCSGAQVAIEGNMGVAIAMEAEVGLNDFEMRRRQLLSFTTVNLFDVMTDMCEELEDELECGSFMSSGCNAITDIVSVFGWNGDIPIPDGLSFDLLSFEIPVLSTTLPITECSDADEPTTVSIPPPTDEVTFTLRGRSGSEHVILKDKNGWEESRVLTTGKTEWNIHAYEITIEYTNDKSSERDVYFNTNHNVQITLPHKWATWKCGTAGENSRCQSVRRGTFAWNGVYHLTFQAPPPCPGQFQMVGQALQLEAECQSFCPEDCMQRWHILDNGAHQLQCGPLCENFDTLFHVRCHTNHWGGRWLDAIWEGPKHSSFEIAQVTVGDYEFFASHPVCGDAIRSCKEAHSRYGYYVRASNGDCALTLNCHNPGYSGLQGSEVAKWDVSIRSEHAGGQIFSQVWYGSPDTTFSVAQMNDDTRGAFWEHSVCGKGTRSCFDLYKRNVYYVQASNGDCVLTMNCHNAGYSHLRARHMTEDWQVSVFSPHQTTTFSQPWKGYDNSLFAVQQVSSNDFEKLSQHPYCGKGLQYCMDEHSRLGFYVAADNGDCVMTLNCHNPGYSNLQAIKTAHWLVSARSSLGYFERVWTGAKNAQFRFSQITDAVYNEMILDPYCGDAIRQCKEDSNKHAYFVEANDGSCVMPLDCTNSGYAQLDAVRQD